MSTTVVDKLIVEFGLDPRQFKAGLKEAGLAITSTKDTTNKGANEMVASLRRVAAEFVSLFLAIRSIKDVANVFKDLNESTRQLGFNSRNTDESAASLQNLGNIAEIAGGKAEDAFSTIMGLQKAVWTVSHGGDWSNQLTEFGRLGVDTGANTGQLRNAHDLLRDTAGALEQQYPDKASRYQETQVLGLQGGIANLVGSGVKEFDRLWKEQLSIPQVTQNDTKQAQNLTESWDVLKQRVEAELRKVLTAISPALQKLFKGIGDFIAQHSKDITEGIQTLLSWFSGPGPQNLIDGLVTAANAVWDFAKAVVAGRDAVAHPLKNTGRVLSGLGEIAHYHNERGAIEGEEYEAATKYNIPVSVMRDPMLPAHGAPGQAAMIAQYLVKEHQDAGGDKGDPDWGLAIDSLRAKFGTTNTEPIPDAAQAAAGAASSPKARAIVGSKPTAFNESSPGAGSNSVRIDELNVYSASQDATGIASDIGNALQRKLTVSFADGALS